MHPDSPNSELHQIPPGAALMKMTMGYMVSQAVTVAAKYKFADHLKDGPLDAEKLAKVSETHAPSLYRLMRALASAGVFHQDAENRFSNTVLSELLRSDHPESLRVIIEMMGSYEHWNAHGNLAQTIKTGEIAFDYTFGMPVFPYFASHPDSAKLFDAGMVSFTAGIAHAVAGTYDFGDARTIADIGGGHGFLISTVISANPEAMGILFDQPQVVAGAAVDDRITVIGGDFFASIPVEADVYLMKHIIHDWNDDQSVAILSNLARSAKPGSKLLLIECVVAEDSSPSMSKVMDLNMLVVTGGKERTAREYAELLDRSGFKLIGVHGTPSPVQIVEAIRT